MKCGDSKPPLPTTLTGLNTIAHFKTESGTMYLFWCIKKYMMVCAGDFKINIYANH